MRHRPLAFALALLSGTLLSSSREAQGDAPAAPLARHLGRSGRAHPLADPGGRIPVLVPLPRGVDARSLGLLPVAPGLGAIRLAPGEVGAYADGLPGLSLLTGPPRQPLLDMSGQLTRATSYRNSTGMTGAGAVVGVVDTGFDVTHPDMRDAEGKTRIRWMLQAGPPLGLHPELEEEYGCTDPDQAPCAILAAEDIDAMLAAEDVGNLRDPVGHGTHVASIAAGNGGPMTGQVPRYIGVAAGATLVVAAPSPPGAGFQDADLLNATRFIFDRADELGMPAVVNLSVGGDFGPHDGTSPIEKGLAAMVGDDKPGRAIVVAAGNSGALFRGDDEGPLGIHTEARIPPSATVRVPIRTPKAEKGQGYVWITFRPGDEVSVGLEGPDGSTWIGMTPPGDDTGYTSDDEKTTAAVINRLANGKSPITADTNSAVVAWDGRWDAGEITLLLEGRGDAQLWLVGLGDVSTSSGIGIQFVRGMKQGTITVPASDPSLLAVGCTVNRIAWMPLGSAEELEIQEFGGRQAQQDSICYFSSAGPTPFGVPKPEIGAPGGFVAGAMATDADPRSSPGSLFDQPGCPGPEPCFLVDEYHAITAGSSMSAPQVAGAVALLFERDPNLTQAQVTDILQAGARYPQGYVPYETQLGPGVLDVEGAMQALAMEQASDVAPAIDRSWFVLSSSYARPDPSWPVWGTIELRRGDGSIASGLSGNLLEVRVTGGSLTTPLTKVRHGMWRFAASAPSGAIGTTMTVEVLYDGVSLGSRELPVGTDVWAANGDPSATSAACSCAVAGADEGTGRAGSLAALAALAAWRLSAGRGRARSRACPPRRARRA